MCVYTEAIGRVDNKYCVSCTEYYQYMNNGREESIVLSYKKSNKMKLHLLQKLKLLIIFIYLKYYYYFRFLCIW